MNIAVKRKHSLFDKDFTHAHIVFIDGEQTGEAVKYNDIWSYKHNGIRLKISPIFVNGRSNYSALADAIWVALNRYELSGLTGFEHRTKSKEDDDFVERVSNYRRPIVHLPTGRVFNTVIDAAKAVNLAESTIRTYVNPKYKGASYSLAAKDWEYFDKTKHKFFNQ